MRWLKMIDSINVAQLPRGLQNSGDHRTLVNNLTRASLPRIERLLMSLDELEREVRDSMAMQDFEYKCKYLFIQFS